MKFYKNYTPLVSIILATFNRRNLLERAVNSVFAQTFTEWELIIVDDGSSDNTFTYVDKLLQQNERIKYIKHKNRKPPLTFNTGIAFSCGKYITFLGSDDEYKPEHVDIRQQIMEKDSSLDLLHGGVEIIGEPYVKDKNNMDKLIHLSKCIVGGTFFGKREVFIDLNGFKNLEYSDDSDFFERARKIYKIKKIKHPTYIYYRDTEDSICNTI